MASKSFRPRMLATTIICGAAGVAAPALAQEAPAVQEVVVTGSRIPQPNLTSTSPLTVVNNQEIKFEGAQRVEQLLENLPQVFTGQNSTESNGAAGVANVNLRGLGSVRTLVLVDGRRLEPGDPLSPVADLNNIPTSLVQRIDVITGGASAVYGADAVAGVVNFVMQHNFQGVKLDVNSGIYQHDNGDSFVEGVIKPYSLSRAGYPDPTNSIYKGLSTDVTVTVGVNAPDDRGNITAYAGYRRTESVLQNAYDYSACSLSEVKAPVGGFTCGGSGTNATGQFEPQSYTTAGGVSTKVGGDYTVDPKTGLFRPYSSATDAFNFAPYNYFQRPDTRYTAGSFAHYQVNPQIDVYADFMFMDDFTDAQIAPSGLFGQTFTVPCSNPYLTASELTALCKGNTTGTSTVNVLRRNVEGGGRDNQLRHDDYRLDLGMRGDLNKTWHYDGYIQYGQSILNEQYLNDFSLTNAASALNVTGTAAAPVCPPGIGGQACSPYNIFQPGGVTPAALKFLELPGFETGDLTEQVASFALTGKLGDYGIQSPFASDGLGVALGTEYRREGYVFQTDAEFSSGDLAGQGGPTIGQSGSYAVYELFGELRAPLVSDKPFIKDLSVDVGYRFSDYTTIGDTNTYKLEANYSPSSDLRFRASYNRAVRAPTVVELFAPATVGTGGFNTDPCAGAAVGGLVNGFTAAQCARTGVTASEFGNISANIANQYNALSGGNPHLGPEISDSYTGGVVFTPSFLPGFTATIDYFNIFISHVISTLPAQNTINSCVNSDILCNLITRAPNTGSLFLGTQGYVVATNVNAGSLETSGLDLTANYRLPLPGAFGMHSLGRLDFSLVGTYLDSLITESVPGSGSHYNCAGYYGPVCSRSNISGSSNPRWRHELRATWTTPYNAQISAAWRFLDNSKSDARNANIGGVVYPVDATLPAVSYFDLTANIRIHDGYTLRVGVNNVLDQQPPLIGSNKIPSAVGNGNTLPGTYDSLGRYLFAGITAEF